MKLYRKLFRSALKIRLVEKRIVDLYPSDLIQSPVHLSIGQEHVAVGFCENLQPDDWVFINYRGHAFYLARGGPLPEFFAELMGRRTGICKGKGGSMHLASPQHGIIGASAVVASTIPHAVGSALASKIRGEERLFVANFGDGAMDQGVFHESLNFAALKKLRVVFLCEDNGLAVHSPASERQAFSLRNLAKAYGIEYEYLAEGYDLEKVCQVSAGAIHNTRDSGKPFILHIQTARYMEHVGPGEDFAAGYRDKKAIDGWKSKDPLVQDENLCRSLSAEIEKEIDQAVDFAKNSPVPEEREILTDVC
jgi:pyruvate dehydrogenase E1 component alpha subunit